MKATAIVVLLVALAEPAYTQQDPLVTAKDLYASAAYEEALTTLAPLSESPAPDVARQANQYRAYCLFALGRTAEAEQVAEALVRKDPLARLTEGEVSPRIEKMLAAVRKRVLPSLIREEYKTARSALDAKNYTQAEPHLVRVSRMLTELRDSGVVDDTLSDLSLLVDGFLGLSRATSEQQAARSASTAPANALSTDPPAPTPGASAPAARPGRGGGRASPVVVDPVVINQDVPPPPPSIAELMRRTSRKGLVIEVVIDERGDVQDALIVEAGEPTYDQIVLKRARQWKYRPATRDGVPVTYRKVVRVTFQQGPAGALSLQ